MIFLIFNFLLKRADVYSLSLYVDKAASCNEMGYSSTCNVDAFMNRTMSITVRMSLELAESTFNINLP